MTTPYRCYRLARFKSISGDVDVPVGAALDRDDSGMLFYDGKPLCRSRSANGTHHFVSDADGRGDERGRLISVIGDATRAPEISPALSDDENAAIFKRYQRAWENIWTSDVAAKYRRAEHEETWLWSEELNKAPIDDLTQIAALVG